MLAVLRNQSLLAAMVGKMRELVFSLRLVGYVQEMTLDEYEKMMAEKNPKANKDAPKTKVCIHHIHMLNQACRRFSLLTLYLSQSTASMDLQDQNIRHITSLSNLGGRCHQKSIAEC